MEKRQSVILKNTKAAKMRVDLDGVPGSLAGTCVTLIHTQGNQKYSNRRKNACGLKTKKMNVKIKGTEVSFFSVVSNHGIDFNCGLY